MQKIPVVLDHVQYSSIYPQKFIRVSKIHQIHVVLSQLVVTHKTQATQTTNPLNSFFSSLVADFDKWFYSFSQLQCHSTWYYFTLFLSISCFRYNNNKKWKKASMVVTRCQVIKLWISSQDSSCWMAFERGKSFKLWLDIC